VADRSGLVIAFFGSGEEADTAASRLVTWTRSNPLARLEAVAVLAKDPHGTLSATSRLGPRETRKGAGIGLLAGAIGVIASGGLPLKQGLLAGAAGGGAVGWFFHKSLRLDAETAAGIAHRLDPGRAAVAVVLPARQAAAIADRLEEYGGTRDTAGPRPAHETFTPASTPAEAA
jgi:hypothetical protein